MVEDRGKNEDDIKLSLHEDYKHHVGFLFDPSDSLEDLHRYLYMPHGLDMNAEYYKILHSGNRKVGYTLKNICLGMPRFRPTIKLHKDPRKVRPVISKRGTPSITIGRVIRKAFENVG